MKIRCESCSAEYDLDESRIPPSGVQMKCPACLHQFLVKKPSAAPASPPRKEIELSHVGDDVTPLPPDVPGMSAPPTQREIPLAAVTGEHAPKRPSFDDADLPAPKATREEPELPAPKRPSQRTSPVPAMAPPTIKTAPPAMVPTLKAPASPTPRAPTIPGPPPTLKSPPMPMPPPVKSPAMPAPPTTKTPPLKLLTLARPPSAPPAVDPSDGLVDLPAPVSARHSSAPSLDDQPDLPAPKGPSQKGLRAQPVVDLPAPKRPAPAVDLDAPDPEDMPLAKPRPATPAATFEMPSAGIDIDVDLVAPKLETMDVAPKAETLDLAPKLETMDLRPKAETMDLRPKAETMDLRPKAETMDLAPKPETFDLAPKSGTLEVAPKGTSVDFSLDEATPIEGIKVDQLQGAATKPAAEAPKKRRGVAALIAVTVVLLLVGGAGVGLGLFTSAGWFGVNLITGKSAEVDAKLQASRKLMLADTLAGYKKAALDLRGLTEADARLTEALALEAQARLAEARLGVATEARTAEGLLGKLPTEPKEITPEVARARALRLVVAGPPGPARSELKTILSSTPSDAVALTYLGWTELGAGDPVAADGAFAKAAQAEPGRTAALYGRGQALESQGKNEEAAAQYALALKASPDHFGAAVGAERVAAAKSGADVAQQKIEDLITKRSSSVGPRELADAWATLGVLAAQAGRREEAEDRLKKALAHDADSVRGRVAMAQVDCDAGRASQAVAPMKKLLASQPGNLEARLALVRALVESGQAKDAAGTLEQAAKQAPKDARVAYLQGRLALADGNDREGALKKFKEAVAADPRYIAAWLAESTTLAQLGKNDEALDALKQAETKASDDPQLTLELGQAYLGIHRATDAEARFRSALTKKPDFLPARMALAGALEAQNRLDDVQKEYQAVAAKQADYPGLLERQAALAARQGKRDEAWTLYGKALAQGVPTAGLKLQVASLALELGKLDDARKLVEEVVRADDRNAAAYVLQAKVLMARQNFDEAFGAAHRAVTLADLPEAHLVNGRALELLGKFDQAQEEYNLARHPPVEGEAALGRARVMVRQGATRDALTELAALAKDPKLRAQALLLQGDCFADQSQKDKARKAYEDAVKASPDSGEAAFKLGRMYLDAGKRPQAAAMLERSLKLGGDKAPYAVEAWLLDGDVHRESKEKDAAVRAYKKYLELAPLDASSRGEVTRQLSLLGGS
jgi:predicted Zn finger-like uncharacterized protein